MDLWLLMYNFVLGYGYLGAFTISILGNISVILPVPFTLVIYAFGSVLNPLLLGLAAGLGSTIGEFSAYLIGRGSRRLVEKTYGEKLDLVKSLVGRYGALIIFLFALLPLPDDLILIPLGMIEYSWQKVLLSMFLGKTIMCVIIAYAGLYSYSSIAQLFESSGPIGGVASLVLLAVVLYAMLKIDWAKIVEEQHRRSVGA